MIKKREEYLSRIRPFYNKELIKVLIGVRRAGKSTILKQIIEEIKESGIKDDQIIYISFEFDDFDFITNRKELSEYIKSLMKAKKRYYLFIDEVQKIEGWERVINSIHAKKEADIYLTGSNGDLLSTEITDLLTGRFVSFMIFPFNFKEAFEYCLDKGVDKEQFFNDFMTWGGIPIRYTLDSIDDVKIFLDSTYNSILYNDIVKRFNVRDIELLERISKYIVTTPSQEFSVDSIAKYFESINRKVSKETIYNYVDYMNKALLISKAERYDVRGKRILTGKYKYYLTDLGLGQIINGSNQKQIGAYLENIVYNELLIRGYKVYVGTLENGEIDFVAEKGDRKEYYQVTYLLNNSDTLEREFKAFDVINDNYPKILLSLDKMDFSRNGILHYNIIDWLLNK